MLDLEKDNIKIVDIAMKTKVLNIRNLYMAAKVVV